MPVINKTNLRDKIPVFREYPVELVCEADGNPYPTIQWQGPNNSTISGNTLTVSEPGLYTCKATNKLGSASHDVKVILEGINTLQQLSHLLTWAVHYDNTYCVTREKVCFFILYTFCCYANHKLYDNILSLFEVRPSFAQITLVYDSSWLFTCEDFIGLRVM